MNIKPRTLIGIKRAARILLSLWCDSIDLFLQLIPNQAANQIIIVVFVNFLIIIILFLITWLESFKICSVDCDFDFNNDFVAILLR